MEIIRENDGSIITMIPLLVQWGIKRCNIKKCNNEPNTIIVNIHPNAPKAIGLCEDHYQAGNKPGGCKMDFEWEK